MSSKKWTLVVMFVTFVSLLVPPMIFAQNRSLFVFSFLFFSLINISLLCRFFIFKKDPLSEFLAKLVSANAIGFFITHRINTQLKAYELAPHFYSVWSWLNWGLVMILFFLFLVSYLIRNAPVAKANRPIEILLPLVCAVLPFVIYDSTTWSSQPLILKYSFLRDWLQPIYVQTPHNWNVFSIVFILVGNAMIITAMLALKHSFSILAEVRVVVTHGIYKYLRHPIYVGEILATVGILFLSPSKLNIVLTLVFILGLCIRSKVEEKKLAAHDVEYQVYQQKTFRGLP